MQSASAHPKACFFMGLPPPADDTVRGELSAMNASPTLLHRRSTWVAAADIGVMFAGSTIVTPLYVLYQQAFGFSGIVLTLIYSAYALGNVGALFLIGRLSDQIGRKKVVLPAIALAAGATLLFFFARGVGWL